MEVIAVAVGQLQVGGKPARSLMTEIPKELNELLETLGLIKLFATVPAGLCSQTKTGNHRFCWLF